MNFYNQKYNNGINLPLQKKEPRRNLIVKKNQEFIKKPNVGQKIVTQY